uniref:coiled-coil domain-containing protein 42 homolog n=1 Tax=Pristiophorus japonicus TaxID=55135 RepID=UPI00398F610A
MADTLADYFKDLFKERLLVQMPEREEITLASVTLLLEKKRELAEMDAALDNQKEEFRMKIQFLQQRREDLNRKEEELKQSIYKFDKFLEENKAKQTRAKTKIATETELAKQKRKEILRLKAELASLIKKREKLKVKVMVRAIYPNFLEKVIKISNEFQDIRMVNTRFETLFITHDILLKKYQEDQEIIKKMKSDLRNFIKEKNNDTLRYHNLLASLQYQLETAKDKTLKGESLWVHIQNTAAKRTLVWGMTKMAIFNLYMQFKKKEMRYDIIAEDTNMQLNAIQEYILQVREIIHDFKKSEMYSSHSVGPL